MKYTALRTIPCTPEEIHSVLTDLAAGPGWIPTLTSVELLHEDRPEEGYELRIREQMPVRFKFDSVSPLRIDYSIIAAEMSERGTFRLTPTDSGTIVDHRFSHAGALLILMRHVFAHTADARLRRLERRVAELRLKHDRASLGRAGARQGSLR